MKSQCRICDSGLTRTFVDLGASPLANSFIDPQELKRMEPYYPLHAYVCESCYLVQLGQIASPKHIFEHYLYFSSYSSSWLRHAEEYVDMALRRFSLHSDSQVIEIASNDGYLLQYFHQRGIRTLGIEPARNVAEISRGKGIPTRTEFFGEWLAAQLVQDGIRGDLIIANNVLAHVPDLHDFLAGLRRMLHPEGMITIEFPHLLNLIRYNQFDTIYHEHFSYFSLIALQQAFSRHWLKVVEAEEIATHGGSLRLFVTHESSSHPVSASVDKVIELERQYGLDEVSVYAQFAWKVERMRIDIIRFFLDVLDKGKTIAGYGAPAKGNTLLNYCRINRLWLPYTVDRNSHKQGLYLPGSRIPIKDPAELRRTKPDFVLILPWNLRDEIMEQCAYIREWGGKFVVLVPEVEVM